LEFANPCHRLLAAVVAARNTFGGGKGWQRELREDRLQRADALRKRSFSAIFGGESRGFFAGSVECHDLFKYGIGR
jgi:hypothetical protein